MPGESHGICDGFGTCQCSPPFIGDDCAIKVCLSACLSCLSVLSCPVLSVCLSVCPSIHERCLCSGVGTVNSVSKGTRGQTVKIPKQATNEYAPPTPFQATMRTPLPPPPPPPRSLAFSQQFGVRPAAQRDKGYGTVRVVFFFLAFLAGGRGHACECPFCPFAFVPCCMTRRGLAGERGGGRAGGWAGGRGLVIQTTPVIRCDSMQSQTRRWFIRPISNRTKLCMCTWDTWYYVLRSKLCCISCNVGHFTEHNPPEKINRRKIKKAQI